MKTAGDIQSAARCIRYLMSEYGQQGYVVRALPESGGYALHVESDTMGLWGAVKSASGLAKRVRLTILPSGDGGLDVQAKGEYAGKIGRIGFGTFVAVGGIAVTSLYGCKAQYDLAKELENAAKQYLRMDSIRAVEYADAEPAGLPVRYRRGVR